MRLLSSRQGKGYRRRHAVPDGQHHALCGFLPSFGSIWMPALKTARWCPLCRKATQRP